jgi:hypothetical protein
MFRVVRASLLLTTVLAAPLIAQARATTEPAWPATGVDYSGIDEFYRIVDLFARGAQPSEQQWRALMATPGYRLVEIDNEGIRHRIELAFSPALAASRDSILRANNAQTSVLKHLIRAVEQRAAVTRMRAALQGTIGDTIAMAARAASRYLPPGTVEAHPYPLIAFAVFADDGYAEIGRAHV